MPDQNELLQMLQPYISRANDREATEPPTYTIPLTGPIGEASAFDALVLVGQSFSLKKRGRTVAAAPASAISCVHDALFEVEDTSSHPEGRREPAMELTVVESRMTASLTVGAHVAWPCALGADLPRGDPPHFLVRAAELGG